MRYILFLCLAVASSDAVIYHLNQTEYQRMPHLFRLERHDACLSEGGQYCVLRIQLLNGSNGALMNITREYSAHTTKHYNHTYLQWGVCVTKTCKDFIGKNNLEKSEDLSAVVGACMNSTIHKEYGLEAEAAVYYCEGSDEKSTEAADWPVAWASLALFLLVAVASLIDISFDETENCSLADKVLRAFSLRKNWNRLVSSEISDTRRMRLKGLHGVRSVSAALIIINHVFYINMMGFTDNPHDIEKSYEKNHFQLVYSGLITVQIFFVMSAFLQDYLTHVHSEKSKLTWAQLPKLLLARWLRLTPACAAMIAFTSTWLRHVGSGPLWKYFITNRPVKYCRRYWFLHLLYINNYFPEDEWCAPQTWHVAADMQLYVVGLVVQLATVGRGRKITLALLMMVGMLVPALHVWWEDLDGVLILSPEFFRAWNDPAFAKIYTPGHANLPSLSIGLKWGFLTWFLIPAIMCLILSRYVFYIDGPRPSLALRLLFVTTQRAIMGCLVSLAVISLSMRLSESFNSFFELNGWLITSRLTYCVYLVHMNIVQVLLGMRTQLFHVSFFETLVIYFGVVVMSVLVAVPLHLMVEAPVNGLLSIFLHPKKQRTKEEALGTTQPERVANGKKYT
ncbi:nose resistant to fluoxetine protein 6-like [Battus philenor]|uniref:nose resistant to fluoxetine protein 6-like n=1 Tax=Battus philenor TaxID=42288 RepID=UPI0035CF3612